MLQLRNKSNVGFALIGVVACATCYLSFVQKQASLNVAKQQYVATSHADTNDEMRKLNDATRDIYENLRTLATMPGLAKIDRHATNISDETKATFQHIYNNLASAVSISEVYIVPIEMNPDRLDIATGKPEEPIMMFDSLILNAGANQSFPNSALPVKKTGPEENEQFEYSELKRQSEWLKARFPSRKAINMLDFPIVASPELITCDNTSYASTKNDLDRSGIILSVPFFDTAGNIKGMVSAIILSSALTALLPNANSALINPENKFVHMRDGAAKLTSSFEAMQRASPDHDLLYSEVLPLANFDRRTPWSVWVGKPDAEFWNSTTVANINSAFLRNLAATLGVTFAVLVAYVLLLRNLSQVKRLNRAMAAEHELGLARQAEEAANTRVTALNAMNEKVTGLNYDLETSIVALKKAQDEVIAKSKMAQLGQLVATVAHEIRNPLGGVRTSAFLLQRRLKDAPPEILTALGRIDKGIVRCDSIITQLLDFSRSNTPVTQKIEVDDWLTKVLQELAIKLPGVLSVHCDLGLGKQTADFDPDRMERVITNLVNNAADAMVDPKTGVPNIPGSSPTVSIRTSKSERGIEFKVSDNGPGIPDSVMEKIREPLFTTKSFGTGLGIPAAEKVVDLHGGKLNIKSVIGKGAEFSFHIPPLAEIPRVA
jgi:signal transduction histidine kinase